METLNSSSTRRLPWNKGRLTGQKPPLKLREIWAIRTRLQMSSNVRELALFNLAIDSKLPACDLTRLQVQDICMGMARWGPPTRNKASGPRSSPALQVSRAGSPPWSNSRATAQSKPTFRTPRAVE